MKRPGLTVAILVFSLAVIFTFASLTIGGGKPEERGPVAFASGLILGLIYFYPSINAVVRWHHSLKKLITVNALLGWTIVGWVVVLIWSRATPTAVRVVDPHET